MPVFSRALCLKYRLSIQQTSSAAHRPLNKQVTPANGKSILRQPTLETSLARGARQGARNRQNVEVGVKQAHSGSG